MNILVTVGNKDRLLRGAENCIELCEQIKRRNKDTGKIEKTWEAKKYYRTFEGAFNALFDMKLRASDARTLSELKQNQISIRNELIDYYNTKVTR